MYNRRIKLTTSKHITPYNDLAMETATYKNLKQLASAIILSAVEDCDIEFLTNDYDEWKKYRIKRKKKNEILNEIDYKIEFKRKQEYKDGLFDICDIYVNVSDIPSEIKSERELYESNTLEKLEKITSYKKETLLNQAKLHGWKIGIDYVEPTIFDDDF